MKKSIIITGAGGFVAGSVIAQAAAELGDQWEIHAVSRNLIPASPNIARHVLNSYSPANLGELFKSVQPRTVIHTAAIADIDFCEKNPEAARVANVDLTRDLAVLGSEYNARTIFTSTDTVFDGERGNYKEDDPPFPVNLYGRTKVEAEQTVAAHAQDYVIARVCLVMGFPLIGEGNSFLPKMVKSLGENQRIGVPDEEIRSPIDIITLGRALLELAARENGPAHNGIVHLAGNESLRRFDMAQRIAARLGFAPELIFVQNPSSTPGRAPRPRNVSLDNSRARSILKTPMVGLDEGLDLTLAAQQQSKSKTSGSIA